MARASSRSSVRMDGAHFSFPPQLRKGHRGTQLPPSPGVQRLPGALTTCGFSREGQAASRERAFLPLRLTPEIPLQSCGFVFGWGSSVLVLASPRARENCGLVSLLEFSSLTKAGCPPIPQPLLPHSSLLQRPRSQDERGLRNSCPAGVPHEQVLSEARHSPPPEDTCLVGN